ncbi:MAG: DUF4957 domain-containing protein [Paludibacteraceae bacterium]|nr:DUF4957 domain-containing protein [Paludibacteraceae bacterium]
MKKIIMKHVHRDTILWLDNIVTLFVPKKLSVSVWVFLVYIAIFFSGCRESLAPEQPRLFKPTDFSVATNYDGFTAKWKGSVGADGYQLDASLDAAFATIDTTITTAANELNTTFVGLQENSHYFLRLRAIKNDTTLCSKYLYAEGTTSAAYSIFYPVNHDSLSFTTALLTWRSDVKADRIAVTDNDSYNAEVPLTDNAIQTRRIRIENLEPGKTYRAEMMEGTLSHGHTSFVMPRLPDNLIRISADNASDLSSIIDAAPEGASILFEQGTYDYSSIEIVIPKSITLMGEPGLKRPVIYAKSLLLGGKVAANEISISTFTLQHLELSGYQLSGTIEQHELEPNRKLISCTMGLTRNVNIGTLTIEDCIVRNYTNSVIELVENLSGSPSFRARIDQISINNCICFDLGRNRNNYPSVISITNKNDKNGYCRRYSITNSTFHHLARGIIEARVFNTIDGYANPEINISNCTFDRLGYKHINDGEWWGTNTEAVKNVFDCKATDVTTDITVMLTSSIFGEMHTDLLSEKFVQGVNTNAIGTFMLSESKKQISSGTTLIDAIPHTADQLFPNRNDGNYMIGENGAWEQAGDPRWRNTNEE